MPPFGSSSGRFACRLAVVRDKAQTANQDSREKDFPVGSVARSLRVRASARCRRRAAITMRTIRTTILAAAAILASRVDAQQACNVNLIPEPGFETFFGSKWTLTGPTGLSGRVQDSVDGLNTSWCMRIQPSSQGDIWLNNTTPFTLLKDQRYAFSCDAVFTTPKDTSYFTVLLIHATKGPTTLISYPAGSGRRSEAWEGTFAESGAYTIQIRIANPYRYNGSNYDLRLDNLKLTPLPNGTPTVYLGGNRVAGQENGLHVNGRAGGFGIVMVTGQGLAATELRVAPCAGGLMLINPIVLYTGITIPTSGSFYKSQSIPVSVRGIPLYWQVADLDLNGCGISCPKTYAFF